MLKGHSEREPLTERTDGCVYEYCTNSSRYSRTYLLTGSVLPLIKMWHSDRASITPLGLVEVLWICRLCKSKQALAPLVLSTSGNLHSSYKEKKSGPNTKFHHFFISHCKQAKKTYIVLLEKGILSLGLPSKNITFHLSDMWGTWLFVKSLWFSSAVGSVHQKLMWRDVYLKVLSLLAAHSISDPQQPASSHQGLSCIAWFLYSTDLPALGCEEVIHECRWDVLPKELISSMSPLRVV